MGKGVDASECLLCAGDFVHNFQVNFTERYYYVLVVLLGHKD